MNHQESITETYHGTSSIEITVSSEFLAKKAEEKEEEGYEYYFAYHVIIRNKGSFPIRLRSRRWVITDGENQKRHIEGEGVIGVCPRIQGNDSYSYTSYVDFPTPVGYMEGAYVMELEDGSHFDALIKTFTLSVPYTLY